MAVEVRFEYDDAKNILFAKLTGRMETEQDALDTYEKLKNKTDEIGAKFWFVSDVTELFPKSGPAIKYSKLSSTLRESWLASVSIVKSLMQKSGMKLVGTFRREIVHIVSSMEEALKKVEELKQI